MPVGKSIKAAMVPQGQEHEKLTCRWGPFRNPILGKSVHSLFRISNEGKNWMISYSLRYVFDGNCWYFLGETLEEGDVGCLICSGENSVRTASFYRATDQRLVDFFFQLLIDLRPCLAIPLTGKLLQLRRSQCGETCH